ncbi:MAG: formylglycine-generating enzyme family protein, partial [Chloroflexota bacterium]
FIQALAKINPILAARCLCEEKVNVSIELRQAIIDALLDLLTQPEIALRVRIAAGRVLGRLGDPRIGKMVEVTGGSFIMGTHKISLPVYKIGKYSVTNAEYTEFIQAGGYQNKRWWTEAGWQQKQQEGWKEPSKWQDSWFNHPNQPVVGVSWYECVAYCRWLSTKKGQLYRLPTEAEWEKGSRGTDGRKYPWGNAFEASRLNADAGKQTVESTTPIGIYPTGVSPNNLYDCTGNVWEWCATKFGKAYPFDVTENKWSEDYLEQPGHRVPRGGSWNHPRDGVNCTIRLPFPPEGRLKFTGFRLVSPLQ